MTELGKDFWRQDRNVVVSQVQITNLLESAERPRDVVESVAFKVYQLDVVLDADERAVVDCLDPVHAQVDSPRFDGNEGPLRQSLDVVVVQVEVVNGDRAVEHFGRNGGQKVFAEVQLVETTVEIKRLLRHVFDVISAQSQPRQRRQRVHGLEGELGYEVVG